MGYFTLGRKSTHIVETISLKGEDLPLCVEGSYDFDEGYFEPQKVYLQSPRKKTGEYDLLPRTEKYLLSANCPHAENWDDLARGNF